MNPKEQKNSYNYDARQINIVGDIFTWLAETRSPHKDAYLQNFALLPSSK